MAAPTSASTPARETGLRSRKLEDAGAGVDGAQGASNVQSISPALGIVQL
jgi:hypothetical protein